jgi:hypothetical protein
MRVNAAISLAKGKFATWLNRCVSLYYWRTSVKYCISSGARNVSRQSSRKYMNHARSLPVQIESLKEMARLGYVRGFRELLDKHISANQISKAEGEKFAELLRRFDSKR